MTDIDSVKDTLAGELTGTLPVRRLLVTGGAGFIGANFAQFWIAGRPLDRVVILDALTYAGNLRNLDPVRGRPGFDFVRGDIRDLDLLLDLLRRERIDTIVHFAAESHVDRSITGPDAFVDVNVVGTHTLLKAARECWLSDQEAPERHRFHHVSTDEVYGSLGPDDAPFTERTAYSPNSPYAASKAASDHLVRAYHHTYGLETTISNCSNNYGPYQYPEKLLPLCILNILEGRELPIYGDGSNVRDWLHVHDHCRGIRSILDRGEVGETYNIGGDNEWNNLDVVRLLCRTVDALFASDPDLATRFPDSPAAQGSTSEELIRFVVDRPGHDRRYAIDATRIASRLGHHPEIGFEAGLGRTLDWYLTHEEWWRELQGRTYQDWIDRQYGGESSDGE